MSIKTLYKPYCIRVASPWPTLINDTLLKIKLLTGNVLINKIAIYEIEKSFFSK